MRGGAWPLLVLCVACSGGAGQRNEDGGSPALRLLDRVPDTGTQTVALLDARFDRGAWLKAGRWLALAWPLGEDGIEIEVEVLRGPVSLRVAKVPGRHANHADAWGPFLDRTPVDRLAVAGPGESAALSLKVANPKSAPGVFVAGLVADRDDSIGRVVVRPLASHQAKGEIDVLEGMPRSADGGPVVARVNLVGDYREALVIPSGQESTFTLPVPAGAVALEWAAGLVADADPRGLGPVTLSIVGEWEGGRLDWQHAFDVGERFGDAFWIDGREEVAGDDLRVTFSVAGPPATGVAVAHPRITFQEPPADMPNLVVISMDTVRADRISGQLTPHLLRLAERGVLYENTVSTAPYTLPSHGSLLTGQYPTVHGAVRPDQRLRDEAPRLARILGTAGWTTAAFTGGGYVAPDFGFADGFESYTVNDALRFLPGAPAKPPRNIRGLEEDRWQQALRVAAGQRARPKTVHDWIGRHADRPFFLFVHSFAAHDYTPTPELFREICGNRCGSDWGWGRDLFPRRKPDFWKNTEIAEVDRDHMRHVYDAAVKNADAEIGGIIDAIEDAGLEGRTIIVVTSDHGEEFWEHGVLGHSRSLYETLLAVPLVLAGPGVPTGRVARPVSLVDIAPSLLRLAGHEDDARMQGRPLPWPGQESGEGPLVYSEVGTPLARMDALRMGRWKLIVSAGGDRRELYDLAADPGEMAEASAAQPKALDVLGRRREDLRGGLEALRGALGAADGARVTKATQAALDALGYVDD